MSAVAGHVDDDLSLRGWYWRRDFGYVWMDIADAMKWQWGAEARKACDQLSAEIARLRTALEEISAGDGRCDSKYGPGCDIRCKSFAYAALTGGAQ